MYPCCPEAQVNKSMLEERVFRHTHLHFRLITVQTLRRALPSFATCPLRQSLTGSSAVCHDRSNKALGSRRQAAAASGALSLDPSRTDAGRKGRMLGSSGGAAELGGECASPMARSSRFDFGWIAQRRSHSTGAYRFSPLSRSLPPFLPLTHTPCRHRRRRNNKNKEKERRGRKQDSRRRREACGETVDDASTSPDVRLKSKLRSHRRRPSQNCM